MRGAGGPRYVATREVMLCRIALEEGRLEGLDEKLAEAARAYRENRVAEYEMEAEALRARVLLASGDAAAARDAVERAREAGAQSSFLPSHAVVEAAAARVLAASGEAGAVDSAIELMRRALAKAAAAGHVRHQLALRLELAELELQAGRRDEATRELAVLERDAADVGFDLVASKAARLMGR
jgi:hypothetical protein